MKKTLSARSFCSRTRPVQIRVVAALLMMNGMMNGLAPAPAFAQPPPDPLADSFLNPPASARPQVWWHWVNGNVSKSGITADLEAMKRVGIGGGTICSLGDFAPEGQAHFNSALWWDDVQYAMHEAGRLGLELGVENCEGWSSSGGPWVKPEDAMKMLVWSEARARGAAPAAIRLAQPLTRHGFYRDVAVVAFPTITPEAGPSLADLSPKVTASGRPVDTSFLFTGDAARSVTIPAGTADNPGLSIDCGAPFTAAALRFSHGPHFSEGTAELDASDDGVMWKKAAACATPGDGMDWLGHADFAPVTARYFRLLFRDGSGRPAGMDLAMLNLFGPGSSSRDRVRAASVLDLSSRMRPDGALSWTPPAGRWTIVRFGYTDVGAVNHPASQYGIGLECDKLSRPALAHHFAGFFDRVMATGAAIPGQPLQWSLIDSYETGPQNWTDEFPAQFQARTGYGVTPWLIALTGRTVESPDQTGRFQFDFTRTLSELWDSNYYGYFADLLHRHGLRAQVEAYGNGIFDTVRSSGLADMPMSEFWYPGQGDARLARQVASAAHVYGHTLVGAESFTAGGNYFDATPWKMKREGDNILAAGVNRYYFHSGAHQPWTDGRAPGMTWAFGIFQNRNNTWYETGKAYFAYLARCESLLQQGRFVGDILAYDGEEGNGGQSLSAPPAGYASDEIDRDLLLKSLTVDHGVLTLPSGQRYRLLALPDTQSVSLPVLEKVAALVRAGAVVFGPRPTHTLGLTGYPQSEAKLRNISDALWGRIDGRTMIKNRVGRGWVYWTGNYRNVAPVLEDLHLAPDFSYAARGVQLLSLHRRIGRADSYFVSSQAPGAVTTNVTFRVSGRQPELWDPQRGTIADAPVWSAEGDGRTRVALQMAPGQSLFVVFRRPAPKNHLVSAGMASVGETAPATRPLVITRAIYGDIAGNGGTTDITSKLTPLVHDNEIDAVIGNDLAGSDPAPNIVKSATVEYTLGGVPGSVSIPENGTLALPPPTFHEATFQVVPGADGRARLIAWKPGYFTAADAAGNTISQRVASTPAPITVDGPWAVHFDPRWGGPETVTFDSLVDWTQRPEPGIRYYSGTAEYDKTVDVPEDWVRPGRVITLDLGDLESLANVTLNGHALGCLWSPPYRADVTGLLKPGPNRLQVKVTDTWVNRLIGDDGLPPGQRVTSTTQPFYSAADRLIPSGLFGPVTLAAADPIAL
ncbi:MAG: hypothetical protein JO250_09730 [Armatimonadetes bacterium]|nr:hypothetical protein [Armatimonadota bacterium]